jgi:hypothetical protein
MNPHSRPSQNARPIRLSEEPDFALGGLAVRPSLREACRDGHKERLEPRVMQVLIALARAARSCRATS